MGSFVGVSEASLSNRSASLFAAAPSSTGDFSLGLSTGSSSTAEATLNGDFAFGSSISVLVNYNIDEDLASLTVNGQTVFGSNGSRLLGINAFAFRQSDSTNDESFVVDNLQISSVPEPASASLIGLGLIGLGFVRRRK